MSEELKQIKKLYGENMAHLCRDLFPTILEKEGLLLQILTEHFYPSKFLYEDIINQGIKQGFKDYIYSFINPEEEKLVITEKTPSELLSEAGYVLFECKTERDIQKFRKYYAFGEELCTFKGGRLEECHVFFAVKKDVNNIKRSDFPTPQRQDLYGTSVISIQFKRGEKNTLSIKNRYNHTVDHPDATYGNNLENIIPGLTASFERKYRLHIEYEKRKFELLGYVRTNNGKYYKYNYEISNIHYCPDNIIESYGEVKRYDPSRYLLIDYFILDLKDKTIGFVDLVELYGSKIKDGFIDSLKDMDKISVKSTDYGKEIQITFKDQTKGIVIVKIDKKNNIIALDNPNLEIAEDDFLSFSRKIKKISLPNLKVAKNNFLLWSMYLPEANLPNLQIAGDYFMQRNIIITKLNFPSLVKVGAYFMSRIGTIKEINFPLLKEVDVGFLYSWSKNRKFRISHHIESTLHEEDTTSNLRR